MFRVFNVIKGEFVKRLEDYFIDSNDNLVVSFGSLAMGCDCNLLIPTKSTGVVDTNSNLEIFEGDYVVSYSEGKENIKYNIIGEVINSDGAYWIVNEFTFSAVPLFNVCNCVQLLGNRFNNFDLLESLDYSDVDLVKDTFDELHYTSVVC